MNNYNRPIHFERLLRHRPDAYANVRGDEQHAGISGIIRFYDTAYGTLVAAEVWGLPDSGEVEGSRFFAFHIHGGGSCSGTVDDPFADAGTHFNPEGLPHPYHAGDLPPLLSADGYAYSVFLTDRFATEEIIGKTVIIHSSPDDFTTQPGGNAGTKIACGEIVEYMLSR